jgi:hypothetical protein
MASVRPPGLENAFRLAGVFGVEGTLQYVQAPEIGMMPLVAESQSKRQPCKASLRIHLPNPALASKKERVRILA